MMERKKYFVSVASGEISQVQFGNNDDFTIYATDAEVRDLRAKMNVMHNAEIKSFWRAHVPIMPYHHDKANDQYNAGIQEAFQMIYHLGDEQTKSDMKDMGILGAEYL